MENTINNCWTISNNFDLLKKFASELLINGDSPESKYFDLAQKFFKFELKDELFPLFSDLRAEMHNKYDTESLDDIEIAFVREILSDSTKMIAFKEYAEKNNVSLNINTNEIEKLCAIFPKVSYYNFEYIVQDINYPNFGTTNDYDYSKIIKEMVREYDVCLQLYRKNNDEGLLYLQNIARLAYSEGKWLINSFIDGGIVNDYTRGPYEDKKVSLDLGLQCLSYLTSTPEPYGLSSEYLGQVLRFNRCLFEIDPDTEVMSMRDPDTIKADIEKYMEENADNYYEGDEDYLDEIFEDYGHYKVKSKENAVEPTGKSR